MNNFPYYHKKLNALQKMYSFRKKSKKWKKKLQIRMIFCMIFMNTFLTYHRAGFEECVPKISILGKISDRSNDFFSSLTVL